MLRLRLRLVHRLLLIVGVLLAAFVALSAVDLWSLRRAMFQERQAKLHDMVESVVRLIAATDEQTRAAGGTAEQAQEIARRAIRALRWGDGDYYGVYRYDGVTLVHGNPKNEGVNRLGYTDSSGRHLVAEIIDKARAGGGYLSYSVPRAAGGGREAPKGRELAKVSFVGRYEPWQWAVQAGVYIDDIDATMRRRALQTGAVTVALLAACVLVVLVIGRSTQAAASGTEAVTATVAGVGASHTGAAAAQVLGAASELSRRAEQLRGEVEGFVAGVRAA